MVFWKRLNNPEGLRVIKTARSLASINSAAKKGLKPLLKKVEPSEDIRSKYAVIQNKKTGEIEVLGDYRQGRFTGEDAEYEKVIDWTYYYAYSFKSPFAAYLIPHDIEIGERVILKDLIEDYIGASWNQGDTYRLESCEAIWNGIDFEIQYDPRSNRSNCVG